MLTIKRTAELDAWLLGLQDTVARIRLANAQRSDVLVVIAGSWGQGHPAGRH